MGDLLSQDEIDALLNSVPNNDIDSSNESLGESEQSVESSDSKDRFEGGNDLELTEIEKDTLGEIGNISMGSAATALNGIIGEKVDITTPKVSTSTWKQLIAEFQKPIVVTKVEYTQGISGINLLVLKTSDVKILTNLMMGEDPNKEREISELELSAMGEAMNQMVGSSSTSVASLINKKIGIAPPKADLLDLSPDNIEEYQEYYGDGKIVKIAFRMVVGEYIDSEIMQLLPISFAKEIVSSLIDSHGIGEEAKTTPNQYNEVANQTSNDARQVQPQTPVNNYQKQQNAEQMNNNVSRNYQNHEMEPRNVQKREPVNVQPVQFESLDNSNYPSYKENIGLIMDVPLQVTVELGRTAKMIKEILEFGPGSIVELDKLAGEPVDILVNGKAIAKGEVVVIDESFGVRITDIVHPSKRI